MRFESLRSTSVALMFLYIPRCCKRVCWEKEFHRQNKFLNQCPIVLVFCNLRKDQQFLFCGDIKQTEVSHMEYQVSFSWRGGIWSSTLSYLHWTKQNSSFPLWVLNTSLNTYWVFWLKAAAQKFSNALSFIHLHHSNLIQNHVFALRQAYIQLKIAPALQTRQG